MKGLYNKYHITKADGTACEPEAEYFVLRLDSNCKDKDLLKASLKAIEAYVKSIQEVNAELAKELYNKYLVDIIRTKESITNNIVNEYKFIFDKYPQLEELPIYTWGRYHINECSGSAFEQCNNEDGFYELYRKTTDRHYDKDQANLLEEIDKNLVDIKLPDCLTREEAVKFWDFDEGGGMCLTLKRKGTNIILQAVDCHTGE